jgi:hypothetical protein
MTTCTLTRPSQFSWICVNPDCDGERHYWVVDDG